MNLTSFQINYALASILGWKESELHIDHTPHKPGHVLKRGEVREECPVIYTKIRGSMAEVFGAEYKKFDYRDPEVIWAIAEKYDCFPHKTVYSENPGKWVCGREYAKLHPPTADTAPLAVALAMIYRHSNDEKLLTLIPAA